MVGGPAHSPRVDVVQLAACARAHTLVTLAILKQLLFAMSHRCRDGAVVPRRNEGQPSQNGGDGDNVAFSLPASRSIIAPGSKQDSSITCLVPRGSCKMQVQSRYLPTNVYVKWFASGKKGLLLVYQK
jgi:hypothetical protein